MEIPRFVLDDFLKPYASNARYLVSAENFCNITKGSFSITQSVYLSHGFVSGHLNMVDVLLCFNQLAYVGLAERIRQGLIPELRNMTYDIFKHHISNALIYSLDDVRFRKPIDPKNFSGKIEVNRVRKIDDVYFVKTTYDFDHFTSGKISLALRLK